MKYQQLSNEEIIAKLGLGNEKKITIFNATRDRAVSELQHTINQPISVEMLESLPPLSDYPERYARIEGISRIVGLPIDRFYFDGKLNRYIYSSDFTVVESSNLLMAIEMNH